MKQDLKELNYRRVTAAIIRELCTVHYDSAFHSVIEPLTQAYIASYLGVTPATVSRAASGVTSLDGASFFALYSLYVSRLGCAAGYTSIANL